MPTKAKDPTANIKEKRSKRPRKQIPVIYLSGDTVKRFNEANDQIDKAKAVIEALSPTLLAAGMKGVFKHNIAENGDATKQISSVRLRDEREKPEEDGEKVETVLYSWTKAGKKCDPLAVENFFNGFKTTSNKAAVRTDYAVWVVGAEFDTAVFNNPVTGVFSPARYQQFVEALDEVAKKLKVENPLSTFKVMAPTADSHIRRFKDFDLGTNIAFADVLPTTTKLETERPEEEDAETA